MSKQSDLFIQNEFKAGKYRSEIAKAIKSDNEKIINKEINRVNKILRDRVKKLQSKGMDDFSPAYKALCNRIGSAGDNPMFQSPTMLGDLESKIRYLSQIKQVIDNKTMTLGGARKSLDDYRKAFPIIDKIYKKHGERYTAKVFDRIWDIKEKTDVYRYQEVFTKHENDIISIIEKFHDSEDVTAYNQSLINLQDKVYEKTVSIWNEIKNQYLK